MTERDVDLRLARLHLRTGLFALARAELEAAAGTGSLDGDALADLAEVRWRTGDLIGAGVAAEAHLSQGGDALVALVIATEHRSVDGRTEEAETMARMASRAGAEALRAVFAGLPARGVWSAGLGAEPDPTRTVGAPGRAPAPPAAASLTLGSSGSASVAAGPAAAGSAAAAAPAAGLSVVGGLPSPGGAGTRTLDPTAPSADTAHWLSVARTAFRDGRPEAAGAALGLVLRFDPSAAEAVLRLLGAADDPSVATAGIELLRGDALRLLGRDAEARAAYARATELLRRSDEA